MTLCGIQWNPFREISTAIRNLIEFSSEFTTLDQSILQLWRSQRALLQTSIVKLKPPLLTRSHNGMLCFAGVPVLDAFVWGFQSCLTATSRHRWCWAAGICWSQGDHHLKCSRSPTSRAARVQRQGDSIPKTSGKCQSQKCQSSKWLLNKSLPSTGASKMILLDRAAISALTRLMLPCDSPEV